MQTAKVIAASTRIFVESPYNAEMIAALKEIPGRKWHPTEKCWSVPVEEEARLREVVRRYFQIEGEKVEMETIDLRVFAECSAKRTYFGTVTIEGHEVIRRDGSLGQSDRFEILEAKGGFDKGDGHLYLTGLGGPRGHAWQATYTIKVRTRHGAKIEEVRCASHCGSFEILDRSAEDQGSSPAEKVIDFGVCEGMKLSECSEQYLRWAAAHTDVYSAEHKWVSIEAKKILASRKEAQETKKAA